MRSGAGRLAVVALSWAAMLGSAVYIGRLLLELWGGADGAPIGPEMAAPVLLAGLAYAFLHVPLAAAWGVLLAAAAARPIAPRALAAVYGGSQIAKYLPGNVLHFAGRQLLGARRGWPQAAIAAASAAETALLLLAAAAGSLALAALASERILQFVPAPLLAALAVGLALTLVLLRRLALGWDWLRRRLAGRVALDGLTHGRALLSALLLHAVFFAGGGLIFCALLALVDPAWSWREAPRMVLVFSAAWLAGFIVPGAPGGLGVREAALAYLAADGVGAETALLAALLLRAATVLGDVLCFAACMGLERRPATPAAVGGA